MEKKTAIIIGATGLTGSLLLEKLIADDTYKKIKLFLRRSTQNQSKKIEEHFGDLLQLEQFSNEFCGDEVFCCIGTTQAKTKNKETYKAIDCGIPIAAAKLAKANNIKCFTVISALGANSNSSIFYNKTKGQMEDGVKAVNIKNTYILRPSLIIGNRDESRFGEKMASIFLKIFGFLLIGSLKKYKAIKADTIANAMLALMKKQPKSGVFNSEELQKLGTN